MKQQKIKPIADNLKFHLSLLQLYHLNKYIID